MMIRAVILCLFSLLFTQCACAASFDCDKASTKVEKMICENKGLSKSDEMLGSLYSKLRSKVSNPAWTRKHQKEWITHFRDRCKDALCLKSAYHNRIESLSSDLKALELEKDSDANVCSKLVGFINRGTLEELSVSSMEIPSLEILRTKFGYWDGVPSRYWKLDFNGDGSSEHLLMTDNEPYPTGGYLMSESRPDKGTERNLANLDDSFGDVIAIGEKHLIYSYPPKFWKVNDKGKLQVACKINYLESEIQIIDGNGTPVCTDFKKAMVESSPGMFVMSDDAKTIFRELSFDFEHKINGLPEEELDSLDGLAHVDVDNDGRLDNVIRVESQYKGRFPCSAKMLVVTNNDATSIADTKTNKILMEKLSGYCKPSIEARIYKGVTYVHALESGADALYKIGGGKVDQVCKFQVKRKYKVTP
ncbi:MAG TPA: hypothetical protein VKA23_00690 [Mariprofundaceae bacterium]|nr:hypothetical protein [Mariprofundaceae bacterium]